MNSKLLKKLFVPIWLIPLIIGPIFFLGIINMLPLSFKGIFPGSMMIGIFLELVVVVLLVIPLQLWDHSYFEKPDMSKVAVAAIGFCGMIVAYVLISYLLPSTSSNNQAALDSYMKGMSSLDLIIFNLSISLLAPALEETIFRGYYVWALRPWGKIAQFVIPTIMFAYMHNPTRLVDWLTYGSLATGLTLVRLITGKVQYSLGVHIAWNTFPTLMQVVGQLMRYLAHLV
ncbi:CPBP family intramembrane glutamic endopeptidase [Eupransor demetentiae]|uniref:CAAX protease family (YdiL) n=1 Tax=Eupransor demetentiae TaxID=3109584 RepID=A0ABM9N5C9_9LACO|nr:CAAX protease family (YdiL) [Lactobacillaceae bacterium LMG 33000]